MPWPPNPIYHLSQAIPWPQKCCFQSLLDVLNTSAQLSKQVYLDMTAKLNDLKHDVLPQLISELEQMEESMGLKPGLLTNPVLQQMNAYYTQLANQLNTLGVAAEILDSALVRTVLSPKKSESNQQKISADPNLTTLMDEGFMLKRKENQVERLSKSQFSAEDNSALNAALQFFDKISSYYPLRYMNNLANLSQFDKAILIGDYSKFQTHLAALYPSVDALIVKALTANSTELWRANSFQVVLKCKDDVLMHIQQQQAQA